MWQIHNVVLNESRTRIIVCWMSEFHRMKLQVDRHTDTCGRSTTWYSMSHEHRIIVCNMSEHDAMHITLYHTRQIGASTIMCASNTPDIYMGCLRLVGSLIL